MKDAEYLFYTDSADKKRIAHSAAKKNRKGHGAVRLPSDSLTRKEMESMNGQVKTYDLGKPMDYLEFKRLSRYLKVEYIEGLDRKFRPSNAMLAGMFGVTPRTISLIRKDLHIQPLRGKGNMSEDSAPKKAEWNEWLKGASLEAKEVVEDEPETVEEKPKAVVAEEINNKKFNVSSADFTVDGTPDEIALLLKVMFGTKNRTYRITCLRKEAIEF